MPEITILNGHLRSSREGRKTALGKRAAFFYVAASADATREIPIEAAMAPTQVRLRFAGDTLCLFAEEFDECTVQRCRV